MHKLLKLPWGMILTVTLLVLVIVGPSLAPYDPIAVDLNRHFRGRVQHTLLVRISLGVTYFPACLLAVKQLWAFLLPRLYCR